MGFPQLRGGLKPFPLANQEPPPAGTTEGGAWSADGVGTASFVGAAIVAAVLSSSGTGATSLAGGQTISSVWSASGVSTLDAGSAGVIGGVWSASGLVDGAFVGASTADSVWNAQGSALAGFVGVDAAAVSSVTRRGMQGRGRARNRGRVYRAFWFVVTAFGLGWV